MRAYKIILTVVVAVCWLALNAGAQVTNVPPTLIENFEMQTGTVIVRGFSQIGAVTIGASTLSVHSQEVNDIGHAQKVYGLTVDFSGGSGIPKCRLMVDYDELSSFINGIDYVSKVTYDATSQPGFEASYATKSGLRVIAHSERKQGAINAYVQFADWPRIQLDSIQLAQLESLLTQSKAALDALQSK